MMSYKKIFIIFLFGILLIFPLATFSQVGCRELEVPIPGLTTTCLPALPDYILAIYNFALMAIGIICFGALIYGGFRYLTSTGNPAAIADAKDQIFSALLGLIILFSSYIILTTINPELVILSESREAIGPEPVSGELIVAVYKDPDYQGEMCNITKSGRIEDLCGAGWNGNGTISSIKIEDPNYVMVIHEDAAYAWRAQLITINIPELDPYMNDKTSSVTLIRKMPTGGKATLYKYANYEIRQPTPTDPQLDYLQLVDFNYSHPNFNEIAYEGANFNNEATSITVEENVIAILYNYINYKGQARIIDRNDPNFDTCDAEDWCPDCAEVIGLSQCPLCRAVGDSCWHNKPSSIQIVNGYIVTTTMVYEDADYGGSSLAVTGDIPDLTALGWNDRISSIRVERGATIVIWSDANYTGTSRTITADDRTFDPRQDAPFCLGFWDPADLCPGCGTAGCCLLLDECWNDKVSSIDVQ